MAADVNEVDCFFGLTVYVKSEGVVFLLQQKDISADLYFYAENGDGEYVYSSLQMIDNVV